MHFSVKSFFLSFCTAFLLFALIMACICADIFGSRVFVDRPEGEGGLSELSAVRAEMTSYLFVCLDKTEEVLDFAVFVRVDERENRLLATAGYGDMLIEREGELYYLRSILENYGEGELAALFEAVTGYRLNTGHILNLRDYLPQSMAHEKIRHVDFAEILPSVRSEWQGYSVVWCPLVTEQSGEIEVIDIKASLAAFRN